MDVIYTKKYETTICPSRMQLACDGVFLVFPLTNTTIGVWSLQGQCKKPIELQGHHRDLTSLVLGHQHVPKLLCSASEDYIIVWNVYNARYSVEKGEQVRGQIIGTNLGVIYYCAFNPDDSLVAACRGVEVLILEIKTRRLKITLEGHTCQVTCVEFCPHYSATLISVSEDRTFKVWDIYQGSLIYQSPILSAFPLISLAMNLKRPQVAIGTSGGQVKIFDMTDGNNFRCLHDIDVSKIIERKKIEREKKNSTELRETCVMTICSRPSWQKNSETSKNDDINTACDSVEMGVSILALSYCYLPTRDVENSEILKDSMFSLSSSQKSVLDDLTYSSPVLLIGTTGAMVQLNANTLDILHFVDLQDSFPLSPPDCDLTVTISSAGSLYFGQGADYRNVWCVVGSLFQNNIHVLLWKLANYKSPVSVLTNQMSVVGLNCVDSQSNAASNHLIIESGDQQELTVVSNVPLNEKSPLMSELVPKSKEDVTKTGKKSVAGVRGKSSAVGNHPLTFHTKVKSSGYTASPRTTMFKPKTSFGKSSEQSSVKPSYLEKVLERRYPMNCCTPTILKTKVDVAERPTPINCIQFSDDGKYLACGLGNKTSSVFKLPLTDKSLSFVGHNHVVNSVHWNMNGNYLLTASDDKTAAVWVKGQSEPLMNFTTFYHNFTVDKDKSKQDNLRNAQFSKEIGSARFYYMDKFIVLMSGNELLLYKYHLDTTKQDIKRYNSGCKYKLVQAFPVDSQRITALSTVNGFYSYIVLCAGSNKSLQIFDMNVGQTVRIIPEVHTRPLHKICQNEGSAFVSHPMPAYDLFATAAAGDAIKLWDLRSNRCVQRFEGHLNKIYPCGLDFSPCGRYLATGAEDRSAYIFELRSGTFCEKLAGHTDVVSDVRFHPLYPQLITASADGKLCLYSDK